MPPEHTDAADEGDPVDRDPVDAGADADAGSAADEAYEFLRADDLLGPVVEEYGKLRLDPSDDLFERLVISVLRQQVSMASAAATRERLFEAVDVTHAGVLAAEEEVLRDAGLSRQKTRYVREIARTFDEHGHTKESLADAGDEEIVDLLTGITGVGPWTARMQLLFTFGRPDVFPVGDLGVRKGMEAVYGREMTRAEMVEAAERWAPYRSYASLYLWRIGEDISVSVDEVSADDPG